MYWYLEKPEERPLHFLREIKKMYNDGRINKLSDKEGQELLKKAHAFTLAQGRNLFDPNLKEQFYFLMPHKTRAISGANRSGKSATNSIDLVMTAEGWHPLQYDNLVKLSDKAWQDWVKRWCEYLLKIGKHIHSPPVEMRVVAPDFTGVEKAIGPEVQKWATFDDIEAARYDNDKHRDIRWKNKSYVEFLTTEQELKTHMGTSRHKIYFDEEMPEDYWMENLLRTASVNGCMMYGATAIEGITWTEDAIFEVAEWVEDYIKDLIKKDVLREPSNIFAMEMTIWDNPMNSEEAIDAVKAQCRTDIDVKVRLYGKRILRGGSVFNMAKDEFPWVVPPFLLPTEGALILAIDPHPKTEQACLWIWVDTTGEIEVGNNYMLPPLRDGKPNLYEVAESFKHATIPQMAKDIEAVESVIGRKHDYALCDPSAFSPNQANPNEKSMVEQMNDEGIYPDKGSKDLTGGLVKVMDLLTIQDIFRIHVYDNPRLMTFETLERTRWEARNYRWKKRVGKMSRDLSEHQKPVDRDDHMMENRRRICEYVLDYPLEVEKFASKPSRMFEVDTIDEEENSIFIG